MKKEFSERVEPYQFTLQSKETFAIEVDVEVKSLPTTNGIKNGVNSGNRKIKYWVEKKIVFAFSFSLIFFILQQ